MAYPVHESSTTAEDNGVTSLSVFKPSGVVSGDLLLIFVNTYRTGGSTLTTPSGFDVEYSDGTSSSHDVVLYSRIADGTEGSFVSLSVSPSVDAIIASYHRISNVDQTTPLEDVTTSWTSDYLIDCPLVTSTVDECLQLSGVFGDYAPFSPATITNATEIVDFKDASNYVCNVIGEAQIATAGSGPAVSIESDNAESSTVIPMSLVIRPGAGGGGGGGSTYEPAFKVQHITPYDVPSGGGTQSITAVSSLNSAFEINTNSRNIGGGPSGSASNIIVDDAGLLIRLTDTSTLTYDRESGASGTNRGSAQVVEYIGPSGGPNEFIVRDRRIVTLSASNSSSYTPSGIINPDKCVVLITGILNSSTNNTHYALTAAPEINRSTGEVTVHGRAGLGTSKIHVVVIEFTGSNWTVHYATDATSTSDTGTLTLTGSVSSWDNAWIIGTFYKGGSGNIGIADITYNFYPGSGLNEVDFEHHATHDGTTGQRYTVFVLENSDMTVNRYTDTTNSAGNVSVSVSDANLSTIDEAIIDVTATTSGGGNANLRGTRNAQLTSITNAEHFCHRSGNTLDIRLQLMSLPQDISGETGPFRYWNGSSWTDPVDIRYWNGSSWVSTVAVRTWNGSSWV